MKASRTAVAAHRQRAVVRGPMLLISLVLLAILCFWTSERDIVGRVPRSVTIDFSAQVPQGGTVRAFVDDGAGSNTVPAAGFELPPDSVGRFSMPLLASRLGRLRLDILPASGANVVHDVTVCCAIGTRNPQLLAPTRGTGERNLFVAHSELHFAAPHRVAYRIASLLVRLATLGCMALALWQWIAVPLLNAPYRWSRPWMAVWTAACVAAILSIYPAVFADRSLVSPGNGGNWLAYAQPPFVPGGLPKPPLPVRQSDTGATAWQFRSYSVVQADAIRRRSVPLYNRYSSAGSSLIGQGTSMMGDPLQWLTVLAQGAGWSWDAKLLIGKVLFCAGVGSIVLLATGVPAAAVLLASSAAFLGFFAFRLNHPANLALCYAPWLWLGFALMAMPASVRRRVCGFLLVLVATWMEMNAGALKEGYVVVLTAYFAGGLMAVHQAIAGRRSGPLLAVAAAGVLIPAITAPFWLTFVDYLAHAVNYAPNTQVAQLPPVLMTVLVDNWFITSLTNGALVVPSASPLIAVLAVTGILATVRLIRSPVLLAALATLLSCGAFAFGGISAQLVAKIPLIGQIGHVANTFMLSMLVPLIVLAGAGAATLLNTGHRWRRAGFAGTAVVVLAAAIVWYVVRICPTPSFHFVRSALRVPLAAAAGTAILVMALLALRAGRPGRAQTALVLAGLVAANGPYALQLWNLHSSAVTVLAPRVSFSVASPGLHLARSLARSPYRVVGLDGTLFPGYNASLLVEGINGPEALIDRHYNALLGALGFAGTFGWGWLHLVWSADLPRLSRALDALNVGALVENPQSARPDAQLGIWKGSSDLAVVWRPSAWPRAFLTDRFVPGSTGVDFARRLAASDGRPFAMVTNPSSLPIPVAAGPGMIVPAQSYALRPDSTTVVVTAPRAGLLVLTETDLDGDLRATLDGGRVCPLLVNGAFQGYVVPSSGRHVLRVWLEPQGWHTGLVISGAAVLVSVVLGLAILYSQRQVRSASHQGRTSAERLSLPFRRGDMTADPDRRSSEPV